MVPAEVFPPVTPLTCQVTALSLVLLTVAVNCCCEPSCTLAVAGETVTLGLFGGVLLLLPQAARASTSITADAVRIARFIAGPRGGFLFSFDVLVENRSCKRAVFRNPSA